MSLDIPVLPYNGASGGPSASFDATVYADTHGITNEAQRRVLGFLRDNGALGGTVAEARDTLPFHHGRISGALSVLHMKGHIAMLREKRMRCHVYVLPQYVGERETIAPKAQRPKPVKVETSETFTISDDLSVITLAGVNYLREADVRDQHTEELRAMGLVSVAAGRQHGRTEGLAAAVVLLRSTYSKSRTYIAPKGLQNVIGNFSMLVRYLRDPQHVSIPKEYKEAWASALKTVDEQFLSTEDKPQGEGSGEH